MEQAISKDEANGKQNISKSEANVNYSCEASNKKAAYQKMR